MVPRTLSRWETHSRRPCSSLVIKKKALGVRGSQSYKVGRYGPRVAESCASRADGPGLRVFAGVSWASGGGDAC